MASTVSLLKMLRLGIKTVSQLLFHRVPLEPSNEDIRHSLTTIANAVNKKTLSCDKKFLQEDISFKYQSGLPSLTFTKDCHYTLLVALAFTPFDPFFEEINEVVSQMLESGIFQFLPKEFLKGIPRKSEDTPPLVLTLEHLGIGFTFISFSLALSVATFCIEVSIPKARQLVKNVRDTFVALTVISAVTKLRFY